MPSSEDALRGEITGSMVRMIANVVLTSHAVAQRLGLGPTDSQFMTLLDVHGPLTPGRLAELSGLTSGTVTGVIDRLEKAGFARRERDPGDRRKVIVQRDEAAVAARMAPEYAERAEELDAVLRRRSTDELATIAAFLRDLLGYDA
ncbi:MAG: MarR family transcriptional regulator [Pseudonocardia sp.]|nr:MarR family transcriptional regulator [Pseudonocardia sp.]